MTTSDERQNILSLSRSPPVINAMARADYHVIAVFCRAAHVRDSRHHFTASITACMASKYVDKALRPVAVIRYVDLGLLPTNFLRHSK